MIRISFSLEGTPILFLLAETFPDIPGNAIRKIFLRYWNYCGFQLLVSNSLESCLNAELMLPFQMWTSYLKEYISVPIFFIYSSEILLYRKFKNFLILFLCTILYSRLYIFYIHWLQKITLLFYLKLINIQKKG